MSLDALGKDRRPHPAVTGRPCPRYPPPQAWYPAPGGPAGLPSIPVALQHIALCPVPPGRRVRGGGRGAGMRENPAKGSYLGVSIRPAKLGLLLGLRGWGGSHGLGSRLPPAGAPRPFGGPEMGRRDQGTGAAPAGGRRRLLRGAAGRGGAGASAGPRPEGIWERLSRRTKEAGEGSPLPPGLGPELELVLDTLSGRWRGNPSELGLGLLRPPPAPGAGEPALLCREGAAHLQVPRAPGRPQLPWGPCVPAFPRKVKVWTKPRGLWPGRVGQGPAHPDTGPGPQPDRRGAGRILGTSRRRLLFSR